MIPDITNANLYLLLPGKVTDVAILVARHNHISSLDALRQFYASSTYRRLEQEETKTWHLGPVALYQEYEENSKIEDMADITGLSTKDIEAL